MNEHVRTLVDALARLEQDAGRIDAWGATLAQTLAGGGRLLAAGNGGSAAQAQHLTSELVGRYRDDRPPLSALALHADTSAYTAIVNDFGAEAAFARQVQAHGRPGDVLVALSTSGRSENVLAAAEEATAGGLHVWAFTGPAPNPLERLADEAVVVQADTTATIQEVHQVAIHLLCEAVDAALGVGHRIDGVAV